MVRGNCDIRSRNWRNEVGDGRRDHDQGMWIPLGAGKGKKINSPVESPEGMPSYNYLDMITSHFQNCKIINIFCVTYEVCGNLINSNSI